MSYDLDSDISGNRFRALVRVFVANLPQEADMRRKAIDPTKRGRDKQILVKACLFPRDRYNIAGKHGKSYNQWSPYHAKDLSEVRACMAKDRDHVATVFDIALECHMSDDQARKLIGEVRKCVLSIS